MIQEKEVKVWGTFEKVFDSLSDASFLENERSVCLYLLLMLP